MATRDYAKIKAATLKRIDSLIESRRSSMALHEVKQGEVYFSSMQEQPKRAIKNDATKPNFRQGPESH